MERVGRPALGPQCEAGGTRTHRSLRGPDTPPDAEQDVAALGLDPSRVVYRAIAGIEGVDEKAKRDAGSVAVSDLL